MVSFPNLDQTFLDLGIDKLFIIKNLFEVGLGVVVKLKWGKNYHDDEILERNTEFVFFFEEMVKQLDFILLTGFEYFNCMIS